MLAGPDPTEQPDMADPEYSPSTSHTGKNAISSQFYLPVLAIPFPALFTPPCHPCLGAVFPCRTDFNGGVFQGSGPQGHFIPTLGDGKQIFAVPHLSQLLPQLPAKAMPRELLN